MWHRGLSKQWYSKSKKNKDQVTQMGTQDWNYFPNDTLKKSSQNNLLFPPPPKKQVQSLYRPTARF